MKYYKTPKFAKFLTSSKFIGALACLLIAVGALSWFALSRANNKIETPQKENNSIPSYPSVDNSYNSNKVILTPEPETENDQPAESADDNVSDVPFVEDSEPKDEEEKPVFVLPIVGGISKGYSDSALQYSATYNDMRLHTGVDILCAKNSSIKSATNGTVKSVADDAKLGKVITIEFNNIAVKYCGMGSVNVKENDKVSAGDVIGASGEIPSECADKPHIHIEVFVDGKSVSPLSMLGLE